MRRSVPVSLLSLVILLALALGSVGTAAATAGPDGAERTIKRTIKKVATKVVEKKAKKLSVANAANLGGLPPSTYLTQAFSIDIAGVTDVTSFEKTFPAVPAGTYQASLYLTASMSNGGAELFCTLYQDGQAVDLMDAYGARYQSFRTVTATRLVTITGPVRLYCKPTTGSITAIPANPAYAPAQLSLLRVDTATRLGVSSRTAAP